MDNGKISLGIIILAGLVCGIVYVLLNFCGLNLDSPPKLPYPPKEFNIWYEQHKGACNRCGMSPLIFSCPERELQILKYEEANPDWVWDRLRDRWAYAGEPIDGYIWNIWKQEWVLL